MSYKNVASSIHDYAQEHMAVNVRNLKNFYEGAALQEWLHEKLGSDLGDVITIAPKVSTAAKDKFKNEMFTALQESGKFSKEEITGYLTVLREQAIEETQKKIEIVMNQQLQK